MDEMILVRRAQQGDGEALEQLISRYDRRVFRIACRLMGNPADAADAAQESLVKVCNRLDRFRGEASFATWLHSVVVRTCLDEIRRRKKNLHLPLDQQQLSDALEADRPLPDQDDRPEQALERHELQQTVQQAIGRLREDFRVLVVLRDLEGYTYHEMAAITGWPYSTVKSRLRRARLALRAILKGSMARSHRRNRVPQMQPPLQWIRGA